MRRAVMTGACGFVGTHLTEELSAQGTEVYAICRSGSDHVERISGLPGVKIVSCGMREWDNLPELIPERDFDVFYHLAWEGTCGNARMDWKLQLDNVVSAGKAAEAANFLRCRKFIGIGSVYEQMEESVVSAGRFQNSFYYLFAKKAAGDMLNLMTARLGMDFVWCTCYQPVGKYIRREQVTTYTIDSLLKGIPPSYGPAEQPCDIVAVEDLAHALYLAGTVALREHRYFLGSGAPRLLKDYLNEIQKIVRPDIPLGIGKLPDDGLRFQMEWFDIRKFTEETGYESGISFADAVRHTQSWVEEELIREQRQANEMTQRNKHG